MSETMVKRGRGRPRKHFPPAESVAGPPVWTDEPPDGMIQWGNKSEDAAFLSTLPHLVAGMFQLHPTAVSPAFRKLIEETVKMSGGRYCKSALRLVFENHPSFGASSPQAFVRERILRFLDVIETIAEADGTT